MKQRRHAALMFMLFWASIFFMLVFWFQTVLENRINPNRAVLLAEQQGGEVVLKKNILGHFMAEGYLNGTLVTMIVDTGASFVAIPEDLAEQLGADFSGKVSRINTANGQVLGRDMRIRSLQIGSLLFADVSAMSIPNFDTDAVLLGMNVLGDLDIQVSGDIMRMSTPERN